MITKSGFQNIEGLALDHFLPWSKALKQKSYQCAKGEILQNFWELSVIYEILGEEDLS